MALTMIVIAILVAIFGYRFYAMTIDRNVIQADPKRATLATMYNDGVDFMPARGSVLFLATNSSLSPLWDRLSARLRRCSGAGHVPKVAATILSTGLVISPAKGQKKRIQMPFLPEPTDGRWLISWQAEPNNAMDSDEK
jgi:hypothetical protein